jgi:glucose-6-phosphate dehydrogenase assembly protein OpcA
MAPDVAPIERLEEHPIDVDPAAIEAEFSRIWQETASAGLDESSVRLRVANLVAIGAGEDDQRRFEAVMEVLPERHPCRGILALSEASSSRLEATISAHCWRAPGGSRHVCSEEVLLSGGPSNEREMASAVLALLVPDVPVAVWLVGETGVDGRLADAVLEASDRAVYDSAQWARAGVAFEAGARVRRRYAIPCLDLAWMRHTGMRALVAQMFDGESVAALDRLTSIEIAGSPDSSESLLMAGWLLSRIGLTPADLYRGGTDLRATLYDGTRAVSMSIRPEEHGGGLTAVRLATASARYSLEFHRESGHLHVTTPSGEEAASRRVMEAPDASDAAMIGEALESQREGSVYLEAVEAATGLVG